MATEEVDPRACGVDMFYVLVGFDTTGGSPRMRGRLTRILVETPHIRWIPAHAG